MLSVIVLIIISGSNDKSVIVWDLKGNLSLDSELVRRFTPALFLDNHEEVNIYCFHISHSIAKNNRIRVERD